MKTIYILIALLLSTSAMSSKSYGHDDAPDLKGPYLGQKPPGSIPRMFAPSGLSTEHRDASGFFSPDMKEYYLTRRSHKEGKWSLVSFKSEDDHWHESAIVPRVGRPILTPDGKTMHLGKRFMERTQTGWSEIKSLEPAFQKFRIMRLMSSSNGTYYFDDATKSGPIQYSRLINGKREKPKAVNIKFGDWNAHPFIAPDESYLLWDEQGENGYGKSDLFISFRQTNGAWGAAINLGNTINTPNGENGAYVTPDGKYLFFNRYINEKNAGIYWVDAKIIETLRAKSQAENKRSLASNKD